MAAKGHNVTVLSLYLDDNPPSNVTYIHLDGVTDYVHHSDNGDYIEMTQYSMWKNLQIIARYSVSTCEGIRQSKNLKVLMDYPDDFHFDVILNDYSTGPCLSGFVHKFNYPPVIAFTGFNNPPYTLSVIGGHNQFAYTPYYISTFSNRMSFWERALNMIYFNIEA